MIEQILCEKREISFAGHLCRYSAFKDGPHNASFLKDGIKSDLLDYCKGEEKTVEKPNTTTARQPISTLATSHMEV
jgi:hypothetical protein